MNSRISTSNLICKSAHLIRVLQEIINILKEKLKMLICWKVNLFFLNEDTKSYGTFRNAFAIDWFSGSFVSRLFWRIFQPKTISQSRLSWSQLRFDSNLFVSATKMKYYKAKYSMLERKCHSWAYFNTKKNSLFFPSRTIKWLCLCT